MDMRFVLVSKDPEIIKASEEAFERIGTLTVFADWKEGLNHAQGADLLFVDLLATLREPHRISGYEEFAMAKMGHEGAQNVKLVLITEPEGYDLDFMAGWPDFLFARLPRKTVNPKTLLRMSTYV